MRRSRRPGRGPWGKLPSSPPELTRQEAAALSAETRRRFPEIFALGDRLAELETAHGVAARNRIQKILFPGRGALFQGGGILTGLAATFDLANLEPRLRLYERARAHLLAQHPGLEARRDLYTRALSTELRRLDALLALLRRGRTRARRQVTLAKLNPTRPWGIPSAKLDRLTLAEMQRQGTRQMKRWPVLGDRAYALAEYLSTIIRPRRRWNARRGRQPYTTDVLALTAELLALAYPFLPPLTASDVKSRIAHRRRPPAKVVKAPLRPPA